MRTRRTITALAVTSLLTVAVSGLTTPAGAAATKDCTPTWKLVDTSEIKTEGVEIKEISVLSSRDVRFAAQRYSATTTWTGRWQGRTVAETQAPPKPVNSWQFITNGFDYSSGDNGWMTITDPLMGSGMTIAARWNGNRWSMIPTAVSPDPLTTVLSLEVVETVAPDDAWGVGSYRTAVSNVLELPIAGAMIQHWDGKDWRLVDNPAATRPEALFTSIHAVSKRDVWAVGKTPDGNGVRQPLIMHYDGRRWAEVPVPGVALPATLYGVTSSGPNDVWAVGSQLRPGTTNEATALVMHWDGKAWSAVTGLPDLGNTKITRVYAASPTSVWAIGEVGGYQREVLLHWDGKAWEAVPAPGPQEVGLAYKFHDIDGTGPNDVWAAGTIVSTSTSPLTRPLVAHLSCGGN